MVDSVSIKMDEEEDQLEQHFQDQVRTTIVETLPHPLARGGGKRTSPSSFEHDLVRIKPEPISISISSYSTSPPPSKRPRYTPPPLSSTSSTSTQSSALTAFTSLISAATMISSSPPPPAAPTVGFSSNRPALARPHPKLMMSQSTPVSPRPSTATPFYPNENRSIPSFSIPVPQHSTTASTMHHHEQQERRPFPSPQPQPKSTASSSKAQWEALRDGYPSSNRTSVESSASSSQRESSSSSSMPSIRSWLLDDEPRSISKSRDRIPIVGVKPAAPSVVVHSAFDHQAVRRKMEERLREEKVEAARKEARRLHSLAYHYQPRPTPLPPLHHPAAISPAHNKATNQIPPQLMISNTLRHSTSSVVPVSTSLPSYQQFHSLLSSQLQLKQLQQLREVQQPPPPPISLLQSQSTTSTPSIRTRSSRPASDIPPPPQHHHHHHPTPLALPTATAPSRPQTTPSSAAAAADPKTAFLTLFSTFYDSLTDSQVLTGTLQLQLERVERLCEELERMKRDWGEMMKMMMMNQQHGRNGQGSLDR